MRGNQKSEKSQEGHHRLVPGNAKPSCLRINARKMWAFMQQSTKRGEEEKGESGEDRAEGRPTLSNYTGSYEVDHVSGQKGGLEKSGLEKCKVG